MHTIVEYKNNLQGVSMKASDSILLYEPHLEGHLHQQREVQGRFALLHLLTLQAFLQPYFTNSLHALDALGMVDQTGSHEFPFLLHA